MVLNNKYSIHFLSYAGLFAISDKLIFYHDRGSYSTCFSGWLYLARYKNVERSG